MRITRLFELEAEPALSLGGHTLTYAELRADAATVVSGLPGVRRAAVWAEPTLEAMVAIVGLMEAGVEVVPLNPKLGSGELAHILCDASPEVVVGAPAGVELGGARRQAVDLSGGGGGRGDGGRGDGGRGDGGRGNSGRGDGGRGDSGRGDGGRAGGGDDDREELREAPEDPERVALIIYTSGTTGKPKGVLMPARAIASNIDAVAAAWEWTAADTVAHALPIFHVHGLVLGTLGPLRLGGRAHHLGAFSPASVAEALAGGDSMLFGVPTMYHRLAAAAQEDSRVADALRGARMLVSGSAGLPAQTFEQILVATGQRVVERYGLTETIMNTAVRFDGERRPGEVGPPLDGVELRVVGEGPAPAQEVPWDGETIGEIVVRGPNLFHGYLNRPDATADAMRDGWFWTGDLATRAPDGYVRIVGRKSTDLIKTGGYKVGAGEVESALLEHPGVSEAAVRGEPDEDLGERIVAWVVLRDDEAGSGIGTETGMAGAKASGAEAVRVPTPTEGDLISHVASLLALHKRPRTVHFVSELPRNAMGKVVKARLGAGE